MIKFFRKIRQRLLSENKTGKYLKYAVGEILLVMVGILLALQVSNLNEERKFVEKERILLIQLKNNLDDNLSQLDNSFTMYENKINSIKIVTQHAEQELPYNDVLSKHFFGTFSEGVPNLTSSTYETFKSIGLDFIKSAILREQIINLYELTYSKLLVNMNDILNNWETQMIVPYYSSNFSFNGSDGLMPNQYDKVMKDQKFKNILSARNSLFLNVLNDITGIKIETQKVINQIDNYLNN